MNTIFCISKGELTNAEQFVHKFPFISREHASSMMMWLSYKSDRKQPYKSEEAVRVCYNRYLRLCNDDAEEGMRIVNNSIAHNYFSIQAPVEHKKELLDRLMALDFVIHTFESEDMEIPQCVFDCIDKIHVKIVELKNI